MLEILIVEDRPTIRIMLKDAIRNMDHPGGAVLEAGTAEDAEVLFTNSRAQVVFLDLSLPEPQHALALMERLLAARPGTRVILVTAVPDDDPAVRLAFSMGAYALVPKPVRLEDVTAVFERMGADDGRLQRVA